MNIQLQILCFWKPKARHDLSFNSWGNVLVPKLITALMSHNATASAEYSCDLKDEPKDEKKWVSKTNLIVEKDALRSKCFRIICSKIAEVVKP